MLVLMIVPACLALGCAATSPPQVQTTRLSSVDLQRMTDQMAASLISADVLRPGMVIAVDRVENLTNHIMPPADKEGFILSLRRTLIQNESLRREGIVFVESAARLPDDPNLRSGTPAPSGSGPTHALAATFIAMTTQTREIREDYYECQFRLFDLRSNEDVWIDAYPVRLATGRGPFE